MRVVSSLADIDFNVGRIYTSGGRLVIESSADSTIETVVNITPRDAGRSLGALVASPSAWWFLIKLPFTIFMRSGGGSAGGDEWQRRRDDTGLNKPW